MKKIKLIGARSGRVYMVEPHKLSIDDKTGVKFIKTATEFAFLEVKKEKPEKPAVKTVKAVKTSAKKEEVAEEVIEKEAE